MSLIAIIADTHFGVGNSNNMFLQYQDQYFEQLIEKLTELGVTDLFHAGDLYDVRKSINFKTLRETASFFRERMISAPFNVHIVVGNHDSYNKNSLKINAPKELLDWTDFKIYDSPTEIVIDGCKLLMLPWICKDNEGESLAMLDKTMASVCVGHLDISGFSISKQVINKSGMSRGIFGKFRRTFSGHFHLPSEQDNIIYVGSPYQLTWSDYDDIKRVVIYDTVTDSMSFLENDNAIFQKIHYYDGLTIDEGQYTGKILKVYANENHNAYKFDIFIKQLQEQDPCRLSIIDSIKYDDTSDKSNVITKDTMEFLVECISKMDISDPEKQELKVLMLELYVQSQEVK